MFKIYRGKKKLEKALQQSQQDIISLTEKLLRVQSGQYNTIYVLYTYQHVAL